MDWGNLNILSRSELLGLANEIHLSHPSSHSNSQIIRVLLSEQRRQHGSRTFVSHLTAMSFRDLKDYAREIGVDVTVPSSKVDLVNKIKDRKVRSRGRELPSVSSRSAVEIVNPGRRMVIDSFADLFEQLKHLGRTGDYEFVLNFDFGAVELHQSGFNENWMMVAVASGYPLRDGTKQLHMSVGELLRLIDNDQSGLNDNTLLKRGSVLTVGHVASGRSVVNREGAKWRKYKKHVRSGGRCCSNYFENEWIVCFASHRNCLVYCKQYVARCVSGLPLVTHLCKNGHVKKLKDVVSYPTICLISDLRHYVVLKVNCLRLDVSSVSYDGFMYSHHKQNVDVSSKRKKKKVGKRNKCVTSDVVVLWIVDCLYETWCYEYIPVVHEQSSVRLYDLPDCIVVYEVICDKLFGPVNVSVRRGDKLAIADALCVYTNRLQMCKKLLSLFGVDKPVRSAGKLFSSLEELETNRLGFSALLFSKWCLEIYPMFNALCDFDIVSEIRLSMAGGVYFSNGNDSKPSKPFWLGRHRIHSKSTTDVYNCFDFVSFYPNILKLVGVYDRCVPLFAPSVSDCKRLVENGYFVLFRFSDTGCLKSKSFWFQHVVRSCFVRKGKVCVSNYEILIASASIVKPAEVAFVMSGEKKQLCLSPSPKKVLNLSLGYMCCRGLEYCRKSCTSNIQIYAQILHVGRCLMLEVLEENTGIVLVKTDGFVTTDRIRTGDADTLPFRTFQMWKNNSVRFVKNEIVTCSTFDRWFLDDYISGVVRAI